MVYGKDNKLLIRDLIAGYQKSRNEIKNRLNEFRAVWKQSDKRLFSELCFCICTPQSNAVYCDKAVSSLTRSGVLFTGSRERIREHLKAVRFPNNKARYIVEARVSFTSRGILSVRDKINARNIFGTRQWLVDNVKGLGFKEASHYLRNIGFGAELAILDVHVVKNMAKFGVIGKIPKSLTKGQYLILEDKLKVFARKIDIPFDELDLLFWSRETGRIFK
jgi:N-glycosylase/DNA lyase